MEHDKALALEPRNARALWGKGQLTRKLRRFDESIRNYQAALDSDPFDAGVLQGLATTLWFAGRSAEAVQLARRALDISPEIELGHWYLGYALLMSGDLEAALREMRLEAVKSWRLFGIAMVEQARGHQPEADAALQELLALNDPQNAVNIATIYAARGDAQTAVRWLERARVMRYLTIGDHSQSPSFYGIRRDPGYVAFLHKMNLPAW